MHFRNRNKISAATKQLSLSLNLPPNAFTIENEIAPLGWAAAVLLRGPFNPTGKRWGLARLSQLMFAKCSGNKNCCTALSHAAATMEKWSLGSLEVQLDPLWRETGICGLSVEVKSTRTTWIRALGASGLWTARGKMKCWGFCRQSSLFGTNGNWGLGMCFVLLYDGRSLAMHHGGKCCCSDLCREGNQPDQQNQGFSQRETRWGSVSPSRTALTVSLVHPC